MPRLSFQLAHLLLLFIFVSYFNVGISFGGSDAAPFFANLFLAQKDVKVVGKFETINVPKIINSFQFTDELPSRNDDSAFKKGYKYERKN